MIRKLSLVMLLAACSPGDKDSNFFGWDMDPRLAELQAWSYKCMLDVTGLAATNTLPPPPVLGVDKSWGNGFVGQYYRATRKKRYIKVQITRPYAHVVNILHHENGHDGFVRVIGEGTQKEIEDYANWIDSQCREKNMPSIYPAPPIDWETKP